VGVTETQIQKFTREPPETTRAWTRAHLLRLAEAEAVADVDWDRITFKLRSNEGLEKRRTVMLANPLGFNRNDTEETFRNSEVLNEVLDLLGAPASDPPAYTPREYWLSASNASLNQPLGGSGES
jgi:hypothetical protein